MVFPLLGEDIGNRSPRELLDELVRVDKASTPALGQLPTQGRLPRAHESSED